MHSPALPDHAAASGVLAPPRAFRELFRELRVLLLAGNAGGDGDTADFDDTADDEGDEAGSRGD